MKKLLFVLPVILGLNAGCMSVPHGPSVTVLPGKNHSLGDFDRDDVYCQNYAARKVKESPEGAAAKSTAKTAAIWTLLGAAAGAAIGAGAGNAASGAAIGGGAGLVGGAVGGAGAGHRSAQQLQSQYDISYVQCMTSLKHEIPSFPTMSR